MWSYTKKIFFPLLILFVKTYSLSQKLNNFEADFVKHDLPGQNAYLDEQCFRRPTARGIALNVPWKRRVGPFLVKRHHVVNVSTRWDVSRKLHGTARVTRRIVFVITVIIVIVVRAAPSEFMRSNRKKLNRSRFDKCVYTECLRTIWRFNPVYSAFIFIRLHSHLSVQTPRPVPNVLQR